tara:strand:+ start:76 stop:591 length:516 start_codon:yes stop_codon:yes gene_type:complete
MSTIDVFKSNLAGGGARANQFAIIFPTNVVNIPRTSEFLCKAAALPGQTVTEIPVPFRGRTLYLAGDREFETWETTFLNDTPFDIRNAMENWLNLMNNLEDNTGIANVAEYTSNVTVRQLGRDGVILKEYTLVNCMPTVVSPVELSMDTASAIEEFSVTWRYTHFRASGVS